MACVESSSDSSRRTSSPSSITSRPKSRKNCRGLRARTTNPLFADVSSRSTPTTSGKSRRCEATVRGCELVAQALRACQLLVEPLVGGLRGPDRVARSESHRDAYDGAAAEVFDVVQHAVRGVVSTLLPRIRGAELERARRTEPRDLTAYGMACPPLIF